MSKLASRLFALLAVLAASAAFAQGYPAKPVRVLIGYGAGGVTDVIVRLVADDLGRRLGQPVIVENRTGAGGLIAARAVKAAPPDGYTLYGGSATPFTPVFMKDSLDAAKELQPVSIMAVGDWFVYVRPELGVTTLKELVAKGKTMKLKYASPSLADRAMMALLAKQIGLEYEAIPYKTSDQTIPSLLAAETDFSMNSLAGWTSYIQSGKIRAIVTWAQARTPLLPNVPTLKEQGVDVEMRFNMGIWAPLGTPRDVVSKLGTAIAEAVKAPAVVEKISAISMIPGGSSPEDLLRAFQGEVKIYSDAASMVGMQPQ